MRTRTRFATLFAAISIAVMAVGVGAIYEALGRDSIRRVPAEAEAILGDAAKRAVDPEVDADARIEAAAGALIEARALLAERRVMMKDAMVRLALEVAAILAAVLIAAALAFFLLSRLITKGLGALAAGVIVARTDRAQRFPPSSEPDLNAVGRALNGLLDLTAEQERRLGEAARLEGWREVASFLAHQLKNPLAAVLLAAENGRIALGDEGTAARPELARESLRIINAEARRLRALIDRFRDLAPPGLEAYSVSAEVGLRSLLEGCAARAERAGASVAIEGSELGVRGDRGLLEQAFWNLFANSIEAGSGAVSITSRIAPEGGDALVLVVDSNRGVDPDIIPRLGRDRISTKATGTGLGLILVRRILSAQGGSLELFATGEGGLGARARIPLYDARSPA